MGSSLVLDGGLATLLESRGQALDEKLWSALLLKTHPDAIVGVHAEYLQAGADVITTASYQASLPGYQARGLERSAAVQLLEVSVRLACKTRDEFWVKQAVAPNRYRPLVAASIGPYGAYLANGAEYTGDYDLDYAGLLDFHRERWQILAAQSPDLLLCETIPSFTEARVLSELAATVDLPVWLSFCCRDKETICDGHKLQQCASWLEQNSPLAAIGINCVRPNWVVPLVELLKSTCNLPVIAYPNSGETYDSNTRTWSGEQQTEDFARQSIEWAARGVSVIGGCCRTTPAHIAAIRARLLA